VKAKFCDQFSNPDNSRAHYETTGVEIWRDTQGQVTHFVSAMGTTGTIMGTSAYLKEQNPAIQIVGVQPKGDAKIAGIVVVGRLLICPKYMMHRVLIGL
jgi:cysteine synthase B